MKEGSRGAMDVQRFILCGLILLFSSTCAEENVSEPAGNRDTRHSQWSDWLEEGYRYIADPGFRRRALEASLVNPQNGYSRVRLARYTEAIWGALPVWNPRVRKITPADIGAERPKPDFTFESLDLYQPLDEAEWTELGARMFTRYPAQIEPAMLSALATPDAPFKYGLWQTGDWVGGLVWVELPDGVVPALTCATCHASVGASGEIVPGLPSYGFNLGRALDDFRYQRTRNSDWGPGRVDITGDGIFNPTVIADLRPVRFQSHLQRAATIQNGLTALAVRLETSTISIARGAVRPPRQAAFALALYLWRLGDALPAPPGGPGRDLFDKSCASCHAPPGFSGEPIPIAEVGTPDAVGISPFRITGTYQTPSLRGVSGRRLLTAGGAFTSLDELLSSGRTTSGHPYGTGLSADEKTALLDFLRGL